MGSNRCSWFCVLSLLAACSQDDVVGVVPTDALVRDAEAPLDAPADAPDATPGFCEGSGPVVLAGDGPFRLRCGGTVAETTFRFALCTCQDYASSHVLLTDSFDSSMGPYTPGGRGGSVGTNGPVASSADMTIGGALWIGHDDGLTLGGGADVNVAADLQDLGIVRGSLASLAVGADANVGGDIDLRDLRVTGTLTIPSAATFSVSGIETTGALRREPIAVVAPCSCAPSALLDIAGLVDASRMDNDNIMGGIAESALDGFEGGATLTLPCSRYFLSRVFGTGALTLRVTGRAAIFIAGDLSLSDDFTVVVEDGGELDLFVQGNIISSSPITLGSPETPAKTRLYVGGSGSVNVVRGAFIAGNLYAPRAELTTAGPFESFGSVFVRRIAASNSVTIHYDTAVLRAGDDCPGDPPPECSSCEDCRNQACNSGTCGACAESSDCCAPLVCAGGSCVPEPF